VAAGELELMPELDSVLGNHEKQDIIGLVEGGESRVSDISAERTSGPLKLESFAEHTRAFLQAQNGCNSFCTYCIVPYARGRSRSVQLEDVLQGVRELAVNGYREVVLTGIHLGAYGLDLTPTTTLTDLVGRIDSERIVPRLRIGSVEPNEVSKELLTLMTESEIICPHLHLPLQSGSDSVLQRMGRSYTADFFRSLMHRINAALPQAFIGADVIAGFPGESETEFEETLQLIKELPFSDLHVFPYSSRPGTKAADMPDQVPAHIIKYRAEQLRTVAAEKKNKFLEGQRGSELNVLVQGYNTNTQKCNGLSKNYVNTTFTGQSNLINTECSVRVTGVGNNGVIGLII
jgi:threonylcarbamoyladenosine tRNA methylthiotransferase MtaB